jgi:hypothetical protein
MTDYNVILGQNDQFNIGVSYEIPSKSNQYQNLILEDIASQFNGTLKTFALEVNGEPYYAVNAQQLIVSLNDVVLEPEVDYTILDDQITFTVAPAGGSDSFIVAMATTADLTRTINYVVDASPNTVGVGVKGQVTIDVTGTIESWTLVSDIPGNLVVDVQKTTYQNYPSFSSITGTEKPTLTNQAKNKDDGLSTWNTILNAGDILRFEVESCDLIKQFMIAMKLKL